MLPHLLGVWTCNNIKPIISSWYGPHDYKFHVHILDLIFYIQQYMALADVDECYMHSHVLGVNIYLSIMFFFLSEYQSIFSMTFKMSI